jgi:hypothetical protein
VRIADALYFDWVGPQNLALSFNQTHSICAAAKKWSSKLYAIILPSADLANGVAPRRLSKLQETASWAWKMVFTSWHGVVCLDAGGSAVTARPECNLAPRAGPYEVRRVAADHAAGRSSSRRACG